MNKKLFNMAKAANRKQALEQGYYDGRFRTKVVKDKRREKKYRNKRFFDESED